MLEGYLVLRWALRGGNLLEIKPGFLDRIEVRRVARPEKLHDLKGRVNLCVVPVDMGCSAILLYHSIWTSLLALLSKGE